MEETKELEEKLNESIIKNDSDFINKLADLPTNTNKEPNFGLLGENVKEKIDAKQQEILDFIENHPVDEMRNVSEDEKTSKFMEAIELWDELKNQIKNASCRMSFTNIELKVLENKLHKNVEYTNETVFYGIHLKKHLLNNIVKEKGGDYTSTQVDITFSQAVALYHIISDLTVKGLNKETFAFAHILYSLSEITEIYNYFDRVSSYTSKQIQEWNMGLNKEENQTENTENTEMKVEK